MRHHSKNRKFSRVRKVRRALFSSLMSAIIKDEKIVTTETKARAIRPQIEKLITKAKKNALSDKKALVSELYNNQVLAKKLWSEIAPRYAKRNGGYTRIIKLLPRKSDGSKMAVIELV